MSNENADTKSFGQENTSLKGRPDAGMGNSDPADAVSNPSHSSLKTPTDATPADISPDGDNKKHPNT